MFKKISIIMFLILLTFSLGVSAFANETLTVADYVSAPSWASEDTQTVANSENLNLGGKSAILIEEKTGKILYENNADLKMAPASITKIMTLLLTMEAMENKKFSLKTMVTCSEHAASMGGSQIWLEEGEQMSVDDLLKAVCIKSANDAAVALAELVGGSEEVFVSMMNKRAKELGMKNTVFKNASGLDSSGHVSTARDISLMSRALMRHKKIFEYTRIWMDTLRGGTTELVNTNKLIRFYKGATGLKTGTTDDAGSCISATAERDGLSLIAVVMGFENSKTRNAAAKKLLDYGFSNYKVVKVKASEDIPESVYVKGSVEEKLKIGVGEIPSVLLKSDESDDIIQKTTLKQDIKAPVKKGEIVGTVEIAHGGETVGEYNLYAENDVNELNLKIAFLHILKTIF